MSILVAYLLAPGDEYAEAAGRFLATYREHVAGADHDLVLVVKDGAELTVGYLQLAHSAKLVKHSNVGLDIQSLLTVAKIECNDYDWLVWFGSWSRILSDDWLTKLYKNVTRPNVGAVAATGSWESGVSGRVPNAHLRTNGLMIDPRRLHEFEDVTDRRGCYEFEHGAQSLYNTLVRQELECLVVGANGQGFQTHDWPFSATYRNRDQANLLVADKQTDAYQQADPEERLVLARMAGWEP